MGSKKPTPPPKPATICYRCGRPYIGKYFSCTCLKQTPPPAPPKR